jgi:hypothetical protein
MEALSWACIKQHAGESRPARATGAVTTLLNQFNPGSVPDEPERFKKNANEAAEFGITPEDIKMLNNGQATLANGIDVKKAKDLVAAVGKTTIIAAKRQQRFLAPIRNNL